MTMTMSIAKIRRSLINIVSEMGTIYSYRDKRVAIIKSNKGIRFRGNRTKRKAKIQRIRRLGGIKDLLGVLLISRISIMIINKRMSIRISYDCIK